MSNRSADRLLLGAGVLAVVLGAAAATILSSRPSSELGGGSSESGAVDAMVFQPGPGWRERSATIRRHEILLRGLTAGQAWEKALAEATSLLEIDPFHGEARTLRVMARDALMMAQPTEMQRGEGSAGRTSAYEKARGEARKLVDSSIEERYPDPAIASLVRLYALDGRLEQAIERLRKLQDDRNARSGASFSSGSREGEGAQTGEAAEREAKELLGALVQLGAALQEGQSLLRKGRLADADEQLHMAITWDRQILPSDLGSVLVRDARRTIANAWLEDGKRHAARSQRSVAQASWRKGILADPTLLELRMISRRHGGE